MFPLVGIPNSVISRLKGSRRVFCREAGFKHIGRYISGLLLSPNKTLQGIYSHFVFPNGETVSRRAMHESIFESGWSVCELMSQHRQEVSIVHHGRGREVISLDWTLSHHDSSEHIYGAKRAYDYVEKRMSTYQTVMTAALANAERIDGLWSELQFPNYQKEEQAYLRMTSQSSYENREQVNQRLLELLHYQKNRLGYRKRTEIAVLMVEQIESEGLFPEANYAFDNGVLSRPLTELIEEHGKHWVSEIEISRHILWMDHWQRVDGVAQQMQTEHPESFRAIQVQGRDGELKQYWAFSKCIRLKKYGRKRLVIVHETEDLSDSPRFLLSDARHWEATRIIQTWLYRWPIEVFHEFCKQITGLESAQLRNEEAVKRHFSLSCVAQSILQSMAGCGEKSERFSFIKETKSIGQKVYQLSRESLDSLLRLVQQLLGQDQSIEQILEVLMPI